MTTTYALGRVEARGTLFVGPKTEVYEGMIIGENSREGARGESVQEKVDQHARGGTTDGPVDPAKVMTLEEAIGYVQEDELIEVTPGAVRLRKAELDAGKKSKPGKRARSDGGRPRREAGGSTGGRSSMRNIATTRPCVTRCWARLVPALALALHGDGGQVEGQRVFAGGNGGNWCIAPPSTVPW